MQAKERLFESPRSAEQDLGIAGWIGGIVFVAAALALGAFIRIPLPFSPVPMTLQTLPVLLCAHFLGVRRATVGALLYIFAGLVGLPVFATPFGPTVGYLAGFALAPWIMLRFKSVLSGMFAVTVAIYLLGASWLCAGYGMPLQTAMSAGIVPFLAGDAVKMLVAWRIVEYFRAGHTS